jgi:hypothetical protein
MVAALNIEDAQAVGHLLYLWWWATDYAPEGNCSAYTPLEIARAARWHGHADTFVDALQISGFLDDSLCLHDWDDYSGRVLYQRKREATRKREARAADVRRTAGGRRKMSALTEQNRTEQTSSARATPRATDTTASPKDPDPIWDGFAEWLGRQPETRSERGAWNSAAKELREIGIDPADIVNRGRAYERSYPTITWTPNGLVKHWSELNGAVTRTAEEVPPETCDYGEGVVCGRCGSIHGPLTVS